ncbi:MAG TPA: LacI family DNA-binding transcriptional regulator [Cellulomonadaceae bacterium]|nr:LacI family DNA-binding transcriptional regulator [Cellulomonadaceae bacterium]
MTGLNDVAALAGVSVSAVSRVLSNSSSARVSAATRQRILDAARELDYRPNFAARALKLARTNVIAVVVPDLTNAIFAELMRGVDEAAREHGYTLLLARMESLDPAGETIARLVGEGRVDGVLVQVGNSMSAEDVDAIIGGQVPAVLINSRRTGKIGTVTLPDEDGARVAVEHLVSLGHRRIGLVNGLRATDTAQRRGAGFDAAMVSAGLSVDARHVTWLGYDSAQGKQALALLSALPEPPGALVVSNINAAFGLLVEARAQGIRVPDDLSVVAIHDAWTAENSWPPLTTVRMPLNELGRASVRAIIERIAAGTINHVVVEEEPEIVRRESTAGVRRESDGSLPRESEGIGPHLAG